MLATKSENQILAYHYNSTNIYLQGQLRAVQLGSSRKVIKSSSINKIRMPSFCPDASASSAPIYRFILHPLFSYL